MKWILIIVLIVVIMLVATALSQQYKDKYEFYDNLKQFLNKLKINISFKQEKISDFLKNIYFNKYFNKFIKSYINYLDTNILDLSEITILNEEEKLQLENIVKSIGNYDVGNEINQIEQFLCDVEIKLKKSNDDKVKLCPMIVKLSLLFSIGLAILLI